MKPVIIDQVNHRKGILFTFLKKDEQYEYLTPTLITVYFPYKDRYYQGGGNFEDKILE
ncbi:conserved domain protein [delta proteobacterium NaphS2]|nr:conserved domain protein [delta proteobacterium NaphS2]